jgi:hypothetical protein
VTPDTLEPLATTSQEIAELFARYTVALSDARLSAQSPDGRYVDAYTAGFLLAKIAVRASGFRVKGGENHLDTLRAVPWLMGGASQASIDALEAARKRRNAAMYDAAGLVEADDVERLLERVAGFEVLLREWLATTHAELHND